MKVTLKNTRLGLRDSRTRIPFRYGSACMTSCPQATYEVTLDTPQGVTRGFSGDCFPPSWFDKADKSFSLQVEEMLTVIGWAESSFADVMKVPMDVFTAWQAVYEVVHEQARLSGFPRLLAAFGMSMVERALIDGVCRAADLSLHRALRENLLGINAKAIHAALPSSPANWLPATVADSIYVRHTVGLGDPLTSSDISETLDDGFPETLEQYVQQSGIRYFKVKVSNQLETDIDRLETIARLVEATRGSDYKITLDGNEQYQAAEQFDELVDRIEGNPRLSTFWENTLLIEQPLSRAIALSHEHTSGIRTLADRKIVIIDESDGGLDDFPTAVSLGYRGVSSKNCKGPFKSILNAGLVWLNNQDDSMPQYVLTGEDLCTVGVIPMQSDLALVAALGLTHVERNGHHYHPGLNYLSESERGAALRLHSDLYALKNGRVTPNVVDGKFSIETLQCSGYGFAATPDFDAMQSPHEFELHQ